MDDIIKEAFSYNATSSLWVNSWNKGVSVDPIKDLKYNLPKWRQASRFLNDNTTIVRAAIQQAVSQVVGKGIKCRPIVSQLSQRTELLETWEEWSNACHIDGQQDLATVLRSITAAILRDGDVLVYLTVNQKGQLKIDLIDASRIEDPTQKLIPKGRECYMGVQVYRREVEGYWVKNSTAKAGYTFFPAFDEEGRIKSVLLSNPKSPDRINSYRGMPIITPAISNVEQLDKLMDAEIKASIMKTRQLAIYNARSVKDAKKSLGADPLSGLSSTQVNDANILVIPGDDTMTVQNGSEVSNPSISDMVKMYLINISSVFGIPHNVLYNMLDDSSYSTNSTLRQIAWEETEAWRDYYIRNLLKPLYKLLLEANGYSKDLMKVEFNGKPITPIRQKDVYDAQAVAIQTGQKSIVQVCNENGWDAFQTLEEQLDYEKAKQDGMKARGLESEPITQETK